MTTPAGSAQGASAPGTSAPGGPGPGATALPGSARGASRLGVLADPSFRRFWLGESISLIGSEVTTLALPLTAVLVLGATPDQMGYLTAIHLLPFLIVGLPAGVLVDRVSRRRLLVVGDLVDAVAVAIVPIAAIFGFLGMPILYGLNFMIGFVDVFGAVAWQAFVPSIVGRERLVEANARLEVSSSVASIVGPGLGGALVQVLSAPIALVVDAISYLCSAVLVSTVLVPEPRPAARAERGSLRQELGEGLRVVLTTRPLRALMVGGSIHNLFSRMIDALFVLFAVSVLRLSPAEIGLTFAAAGPGALLGAVVVGRLNRAIGVGPTIWTLQLLTGISRLMIPLAAVLAGATVAGGAMVAGGATVVAGAPVVAGPAPTPLPGPTALVVVAAANFLLGLARTAFNVTQVSLRVAITPDHLHGRMNASIRFLMWSVTPFGAVIGGLLAASALGLTMTLWIAGFGVLLAFVPFLAPSLRTVRSIGS